MAGGTVTPLPVLEGIWAGAREAGLPVHLDGARIFNAAAALGVGVAELTSGFDTVMFCLSKGLGAPVGSMLVGSKKAMEQARIFRKALGGGMRQAGILAAAGLIALHEMPARLVDDHANARLLAEAVAASQRRRSTLTRCRRTSSSSSCGKLAAMRRPSRRVEAEGRAGQRDWAAWVRFVTHYDVDRQRVNGPLRSSRSSCAQEVSLLTAALNIGCRRCL